MCKVPWQKKLLDNADDASRMQQSQREVFLRAKEFPSKKHSIPQN